MRKKNDLLGERFIASLLKMYQTSKSVHSLGESDGACQILTIFDCNLDMGLHCVSQNLSQTVSGVLLKCSKFTTNLAI